jgi:hypothetical protein
MLLMERAFFVGLTEHYAQSLCLLGRKLGIGQLSATGCAAEIKVTHSDYGNKAGSTELSNEVLVRVRAITKIDQYAYGLALTLSRLVLEAERAARDESVALTLIYLYTRLYSARSASAGPVGCTVQDLMGAPERRNQPPGRGGGVNRDALEMIERIDALYIGHALL